MGRQPASGISHATDAAAATTTAAAAARQPASARPSHTSSSHRRRCQLSWLLTRHKAVVGCGAGG
jgi:hypothetical protein